MNRPWLSIALAAAVATAACSNTSGFDQVQGYGPNPTLPDPVWRVSGASAMTRR
ncbi:MAG: hypothetical protein WD873_08970 [Candidatus Hydrogenedentales bacterium]